MCTGLSIIVFDMIFSLRSLDLLCYKFLFSLSISQLLLLILSYHRRAVEQPVVVITYKDFIRNLIHISVYLLIQVGCVTMWNLCLPLLQKDFRKAIKAPLSLVTEALEDIDR